MMAQSALWFALLLLTAASFFVQASPVPADHAKHCLTASPQRSSTKSAGAPSNAVYGSQAPGAGYGSAVSSSAVLSNSSGYYPPKNAAVTASAAAPSHPPTYEGKLTVSLASESREATPTVAPPVTRPHKYGGQPLPTSCISSRPTSTAQEPTSSASAEPVKNKYPIIGDIEDILEPIASIGGSAISEVFHAASSLAGSALLPRLLASPPVSAIESIAVPVVSSAVEDLPILTDSASALNLYQEGWATTSTETPTITVTPSATPSAEGTPTASSTTTEEPQKPIQNPNGLPANNGPIVVLSAGAGPNGVPL
ncbi:hypothetical protein DFJ73DRAFT_864265 [Zopfochytrium polystomum]|nr:hypothetical protein DFJ73DRAFT_864265 [Zopfochytrium polystomum]